MDYISDFSSALDVHTKRALFEYRYKVFVERLGWELDTDDDIEVDQFDHDDTYHIIAKSQQDEIVGCARLLPTTKPYLLEEAFPQLLNGAEPPKCQDIWELSRFTTVDLKDEDKERGPVTAQFPNQLTRSLMLKAISCAKSNGAKAIVSVSPLGIERLLRNMQITSKRLAPPVRVDGHMLIACYIEI